MPKTISPAPAARKIRRAGTADLPAVVAIECEQFTNPWRLEYYAAELDNSLAHFFISEDMARGSLIGFLLFWRLGNELELHKIAVAKAWQRQGHATRFMEFFVETARSWRSERAWLEVRAQNLSAINLYEKFQFRCVGRRPGYYSEPDDDALVYELDFKKTEGSGL
jgi:ribosomal-protein-alanine N-acetyltransferase